MKMKFESKGSPELYPSLNSKRHVDAASSFKNGKILGRVFQQVSKGPNPGLLDQPTKLPHTELTVIVFRDLNRSLQLRPRVEVLEYSLLNLSVLSSDVVREIRRLHVKLRRSLSAF